MKMKYFKSNKNTDNAGGGTREEECRKEIHCYVSVEFTRILPKNDHFRTQTNNQNLCIRS